MKAFLLLFATTCIFLLILYLKTQKSKHANKRNPPAPPGLPLIGNLHHFDGQFPHTYLQRLSKKYGGVMSLKLGLRRLVVISSADAVKEIMKSHDVVFSGRPALVSLQRLSYNGLDLACSTYNDTWREMRKLSTFHLFSTKQLESFRPIFIDQVSKMIEKIARDASSSTVTDLSAMMMSFSSNTISRVAFGKSYGDDEKSNPLSDLLHDAQPLLGGFFMEDYLPWFRWIDTLTGMAAKLEKSFHDMDCFYQQLIEEHMDPNRPKSMEGDIIDILLGIKENGSSSFDLTMDHIKGLLMNIIVGGIDRISATLEWALTALIKKPLLMEKVQAEIRQLAGKKDLIDEEDVARLPYLRAVVKETLRLYPPAPLLVAKETIRDCSINGYDIEGGSMVYINAWAIARDPLTWRNADEFLPERFLDVDVDVDVRGHNPKVIPFGVGRRGCPGIGMGMAQVELALANVLYKFEWKLPLGMKEDDIDFQVMPGITMHKKNALRLVAKLV